MKKDSLIEKSAKFVPGEGDKEFKRMFQAASKERQEVMGFDLISDADDEEIVINRLANEWLRDGKPVEF